MLAADYVEETTTSIASSGAGAVTLTAVTNRPRFSTVFGTQNTVVRYVIEDTVNKKFEQGVGAVSSNVLTRTRPQITWDGTTWNALAPSALTFTGSPTSGDIKIRMAPVAENQGVTRNGIQATVAGDSWHDYPVNGAAPHIGNGSAITLVANQEYYYPYRLDWAGVLNGAQFEVVAQVAASNLKWALYGSAYDGLPGPKILDFVTTSTATTGIKTDTASASWNPAGKIWMAPGWYWIGFIPSHAIQMRTFSGSSNTEQPSPIGRRDGYGFGSNLNVAGSYSTGLPAIPSLGSAAMGNYGVIGSAWLGLSVKP